MLREPPEHPLLHPCTGGATQPDPAGHLGVGAALRGFLSHVSKTLLCNSSTGAGDGSGGPRAGATSIQPLSKVFLSSWFLCSDSWAGTSEQPLRVLNSSEAERDGVYRHSERLCCFSLACPAS